MNGIFDFMSDSKYKEMSDKDVGIEAITFFQNYSRSFFTEENSYSLNDIVEIFNKKRGNQIGGLGLGIKMSEASESQVEDAMESLAEKMQGKIPDSMSPFRSALAGRMQEVDIASSKFFKEVIGQTVITLVEKSQTVGKTVMNVGEGVAFWSKYSTYLLPFVGVIGLSGSVYYVIKNKDKIMEMLDIGPKK